MTPIPIDADGAFAGYASLFHRRDAGGDVVLPGAFAKSLVRRGPERIRMLFQHDPKEPVGVWRSVREDEAGLWVEGRLVPGVPRAMALKALLDAGAVDGLSIGFRTIGARRSGGRGPRLLAEIDLWEISIVTFPMLEGARIRARTAKRTRVAMMAALDAIRN